MSHSVLKAAVKRGALIAAANWPVTLIQASADSLFKLLLAAPLIGGVFLVALAIGGEPTAIISLESREMFATIATALIARPVVLTAFLLALAVVAVGGSMFVFLVKAGTVATLVQSDREAASIEEPPLHVSAVAARVAIFGGLVHRLGAAPFSAVPAPRLHADGRVPGVGPRLSRGCRQPDPSEGGASRRSSPRRSRRGSRL